MPTKTQKQKIPTLDQVRLYTEMASMNLDRDVSIRRSPHGEWWIVESWGARSGKPDEFRQEFRQVTPEWLAKFVLNDFLPDVVPHVKIMAA